MELRKRSLPQQVRNVNNSKLKSTKKRKNVIQHGSHIEDLSGEVWFELFAYFDGQSLIDSFSQLNSSIQSLLNDYRLPIHLNINSSQFVHLSSLFNSNQIVSLHIDYSHINQNEFIPINTFIRLRSLTLMYITDEQLDRLSHLPLNHLRQISIQSKYARFLTKILSKYFPQVNRMILNSMQKKFVVKSLQIDQRKSQMEYLTLNGKIQLVKLFRLWSLVPNLRSLSVINGGVHQCDYWIDEEIISQQNFPLQLSSMHINIYDDDLSFTNLERLISKNVRYLFVSGSMADDDLTDYLSSSNWIRLMSHCSSSLQWIKLDLSSYFDPSDSFGLHKTLFQFRKNAFFRHTKIQSQNFFITIKGYLKPDIIE